MCRGQAGWKRDPPDRHEAFTGVDVSARAPPRRHRTRPVSRPLQSHDHGGSAAASREQGQGAEAGQRGTEGKEPSLLGRVVI